MISRAQAERLGADTPAAGEGAAAQAVDPICPMSVDMATATYTSHYQGRTFYFCCGGCKRKFDSEPGRYVQ